MKILKKKSEIATIALILVLTFSALFVALPIVSAHDPAWEVPTYAYLSAVPNPAGVGQTVTLSFWIDKVPPTSNTIYGDRWNGYEVTVTKPDGSEETFGPFTSDNVGAAWTQFVPDTVGTYYLQLHFPGQILAGDNPSPDPNPFSMSPFVGDYFLPSSSQIAELVVQEDPIEAYPETPLPEDYWQRPIYGINSNWRYISGDWLMSARAAPDSTIMTFNPYSTAPDTGHIVWTYPVAFGGVNGGEYPDWNYYTGLTYESKFNNPVIMYGRLYFNLPLNTVSGRGGTVCIDLRTGEELWRQKDVSITFGQEFDYQSPNQFGAIPYLWSTGSTYKVYDPWTGEWLFSLENASTGSTTYGPNGELLVYILNGMNNWLAMWNSTKAITPYHANVWEWRPMDVRTMDWQNGIQWNVTTNSYKEPATQAISAVTSDVILATSGNFLTGYNWQWEIGYSATTGEELWVQNRTTPMGSTSWALMGPAGDGVYTEFHLSSTQWQGFDLYTGKQLWGPTEPYPRAFGMYSWRASISYGKLLATDYGGYLHAYDIKTGENLWNFFAGSSGLETPYGAWPLNHPSPVSADGKIYVTAGHGYNPPIFKGAKMYCINASDGNLLWSLLGYHTYTPILIADGYLLAYNSYDAQVYCYGKGQTETRVTASPKVSEWGDTILIEGSVTDQSPGDSCLGVPVAGTPAIADEYMSEWMEYLYMQQQCPKEAKGVEVILETLDPNNNFYEIGRATSDLSGFYSLLWEPPVPGKYTIMATFEGSDSYWRSYTETAIGVTEAPSPTQSIEPEPTTPEPTEPAPTEATEAPFITTETAIIAAVAVVAVIGIISFWALRKRK